MRTIFWGVLFAELGKIYDFRGKINDIYGYKGSKRKIKNFPVKVCQFSVYEATKKFLNPEGKYDPK